MTGVFCLSYLLCRMEESMKRIISLLLVLLMTSPLIVSCSDATVEENESESAGGEAAVEVAETEAETEDPWFGLEKTDMGGMTFTILTGDWVGEPVWDVDDFTAEEYTGAPINDAVYDRNIKVEDRLNCVIEEVNFNIKEDAANALKNSVTAADNAYQLWVPRLQQYIELASNGYIMDMNKIDGIDFENPSWVQNSIKGLSILGYSFAACNEMMTIHKEAVSSVLFNKNLANQYQLDDLYAVVSDGKWTLDYLEAVIENTASDLNGDGKMTLDDQWGFLYQRDTLDAFLAGSGGAICSKDENDHPVYIFDNELNITALMRITDILYNQNVCQNVMFAQGDFNVWMQNKFMGDEAMFMWVRNVNIPQLRSMESDFGILPNPKYDETYNEYVSIVNSYTGAALSVPNIVDANVEKHLGLFIETMGAASLGTLTTAYYDVMLNGIAVRDQESSMMLDIIYSNTTYDPGSIGAYGAIQDYIYLAMDYANNFASYNATRKKAVTRIIQKTCERIEEKHSDQ